MADDVFPDRSMALRDKLAWMIETTGWLLEPVAANTDADGRARNRRVEMAPVPKSSAAAREGNG